METKLPAFPTLLTGRCLLRQMRKEDAPVLLFLRSDDRVMKYLDREKMKTENEALSLIEKINATYALGLGLSWAICDHRDNMIGYGGIWRIEKEHFRGEIGYTLHPDHWNKGLASEAIGEMVRFGFEELNLHTLEANVNPRNTASIALLEKLGFVREAYFRENYYFNGKFLDSAIYCKVAGTK